MDINKIKSDFPILNRKINGSKLVYLDSAATSQKPSVVIDAVGNYYSRHNANIHRGIHTLSEEASTMFNNVYKKTASFINAAKVEEIVFTLNSTVAINMVARCLEHSIYWSSGSEIIITEMEHHANILPWMVLLAGSAGVDGLQNVKGLKVAKIKKDGTLDLNHFKSLLSKKTKIVAISHVSNVLGTINPVKDIARIVKNHSNALLLADGAQAAPHMRVNVQSLGCDFYVFSSHKMLGPTGLGVLWSKSEILKNFPAFMVGGGMIKEVYFDRATWADLPDKYNAGTPDIAGVIGFGAALDYLSKVGMENIRKHEEDLTLYCLNRLNNTPDVQVYGPQDLKVRGGVISFNVKGIPAHHCTMPLHKKLGITSSARASFYLYNDMGDVDSLIEAITKAKRIFRIS